MHFKSLDVYLYQKFWSCKRQVSPLFQWSTYPDVLGMQFEWDGYFKEVGSAFIGSSPEFDLAIYSLCYITRPGKKWVLDIHSSNKTHFWSHEQTYKCIYALHEMLICLIVFSDVMWVWEDRLWAFRPIHGTTAAMGMERST